MKYFDYAATTPPSEEALNAYVEVSKNVFGNPGSSSDAKNLEEETRQKILKSMSLNKTCNLIFTSGGTEANNLAIKGIIKHHIPKGSHFITSKFEHASVYEVFQKLENGNKVDYVNIKSDGYIDVQDFKKKLNPKTRLVSFMHVNNELGTKQPIKELYEITKDYNKDILFIVDTVQGLGKVEPLDFIPDLLTISSHKIYGPKSVGAVIMKKEFELSRLILGGTKEGGQRAGTQSLPAQVGFSKSVESICKNLDPILKEVTELKDYLEENVQKIDKIHLNANSDSNVVSIFTDIDTVAKDGIKFLFDNDILLSAKSADNADLGVKSRTLKSIGLSDYRCDRTYRISLSHHKTKEDIDELISVFKKLVQNSNNSELVLVSSNEELNEHISIREEVFIKEKKIDQNIEIDSYDTLGIDNVYHFNLKANDKTIATLRAIKKDDIITIGRVAVLKEYRNKNYGTLLMQKALAFLDKFELDYYIESQSYAIDFYKKLGFVTYGQEFIKANITHKKMLKEFDTLK